MPNSDHHGRISVKGKRLTGEVRAVSGISGEERQRLLELMHLSYRDVDPRRFSLDLADKHWILLLRCNHRGIIQGFSTAVSIDSSLAGREVRALYSGDTVISTEYWGERTIGKLWLRFALEQYRCRQGRELYWFLISMGHRTYRLLRIFFKDYWPRPGRQTPQFERELMTDLGRRKFGKDYDEQRGVVARAEKLESMRSGLAEIRPGRLRDADIAFFLAQNPGYIRGDELVCLAGIRPDNIRARSWRLFELGDPDSYRGA